MDCKTQKGLLFVIIGLIITTIYGVLLSISSFVTEGFNATIIRSILGIISFIGSIIVIIGAILFLLGRKEFGEIHQKNVTRAAIVFLINMIVVIILVVIMSFMVYSAISTSSIEGIFGSVTPFIIITTIITAFLGGLMYYFSLIELQDEKGKIILFTAIFVSIAISIVLSFYITGMLGEIFGSISTNNISNYSSFALTQNLGKISVIGVIPNLLFIYALYIPYKRIKEGELVPQIWSSETQHIPNRICPNCNKNIPFDANICPYCGKRFENL